MGDWRGWALPGRPRGTPPALAAGRGGGYVRAPRGERSVAVGKPIAVGARSHTAAASGEAFTARETNASHRKRDAWTPRRTPQRRPAQGVQCFGNASEEGGSTQRSGQRTLRVTRPPQCHVPEGWSSARRSAPLPESPAAYRGAHESGRRGAGTRPSPAASPASRQRRLRRPSSLAGAEHPRQPGRATDHTLYEP